MDSLDDLFSNPASTDLPSAQSREDMESWMHNNFGSTGWLKDVFSNPIQGSWDAFADIPGSPAAITDGAIGGLSGQYSLNPWSEGPSAFDVGFSGESSANDPERRAIGRGIATGVGSYITGGALGGMMGSTTGGAAASGALWGGAQAAGTGGNIEKAMLRGGAAGGLSSFAPDVAGYSGVTDPVYAGMINGGTQGAVMGALSNGEKGAAEGALTGGTLGGLSGYDQSQSYYRPTNDSRAVLNDITQTSTVPSSTGYKSIMSADAGQSFAPDYTSTGTYIAPEMRSTESNGWANPDLGRFMETIMPSSARGWGDLAQGALGMYGAYKQRKMARDLQSQIGGNRSAYQKQLTRDLQRRDAASGRRSNYSGRATELQSSLAQLDSRNAPALAQLQQAELGGLVNMFQTGLRYGNKAGWFGSPDTQQQPAMQPQQPLYLPSMIGQQQGPQDYSLDQQRKIKLGGYGG